jgi:hypothetical protein
VKLLTPAAAAWLATAIACVPASAHHSRVNFDMTREIEIDGIVTEYAWRNPHAYAVVEEVDEAGVTRAWTLEMNATPVLLRLGVTAQSLKPGEHVIARGNPDRDPALRFLYANVFIKDDGSEVRSSGEPGTNPYAIPTPSPADIAGSTDFTGTWLIEIPRSFDALVARELPTDTLVTSLPINARGQALVDAFDPEDNPEWDCQAMSIPTILRYPYPFRIIRDDERTLRFLYEVNHLERIVHLDASEPPADMAPSPYGYSVGRFDEDGALVVDTTRFSPVRWGAGDGIDSSERKRTREVYRLADDGRALELTFTLEDPEYLREPATITHRYRLTPGYELQEYRCDPATARRHLTAGR